MTKMIYAIATMDTKGHELTFVAEEIRKSGLSVKTIDVGTTLQPMLQANISNEQVANALPNANVDQVIFGCGDRGQAITRMSEALELYLLQELKQGRIAGVIGLGGSGGTSLITKALRALPIGIPKVMVSTVASGNTAPYVGSSDLTMMYSVVDVAGLNNVSRLVLSNAAHALAGMVLYESPRSNAKQTLGMTMFGVTTACVDCVRGELEKRDYECLVFHATGTGGQAMEKMVASGLLQGVLDITTTEVADEVVGGIFPAGPRRFEAILQAGVPYVMSVGALDMVNFGAMETVPEKFRDRLLHVHNAQVTLMRTTAAENREIAKWIADKLNRSETPVTVLIPEKGVSALDAVGKPFWDPAADGELFASLEQSVQQTSQRRLVRLPYHINDFEFSEALVAEYFEIVGKDP